MKFHQFLAAMAVLCAGWAAAAQELPLVPEPAENPTIDAKVLLGKILFWDEQLSADNTISCGTCHQPKAGGSDPEMAVHPGPDRLFGTDDDTIGSSGVVLRDQNNQPIQSPEFGWDQQVTGRATPSFILAMYSDELFWDGRAETEFRDPLDPDTILIRENGALENQALGPILSSVEMGHEDREWAEVTDKLARVVPLRLATEVPEDIAAWLRQYATYPDLFEAAFGDLAITPAHIAMAVAAYERTLVADQTPWDRFMAGDIEAMTVSQQNGWSSFVESTVCDNCHVPPLFTDNNYYNIGLRPASEDAGREEITGIADDFGRFRTPSLRNSGLRPSQMHVGWIESVRDAADFYNANAEDNRHIQFSDHQTSIPTLMGNRTVDYDTLSFFATGGPNNRRKLEVIDFIENALTDPRVANEEFPFDRPILASERATAIKVMSYNVQIPDWTNIRAAAVSDVINQLSPDVVGLQEASVRQKSDLQTLLSTDYDLIDFETSNSHPILVRREGLSVIETGSSAEPVACGNARFINYAVVEQESSGLRFVLYNSHFCALVAEFADGEMTAQERNQQHAASLMQVIRENHERLDLPYIVTGDLNASRSSDTIAYLLDGVSVLGQPDNNMPLADTWDTVYPGAPRTTPIDWVMHSPHDTVPVLNFTVQNDLTDIASDHPPVFASFLLEPVVVRTLADEEASEAGGVPSAGAASGGSGDNGPTSTPAPVTSGPAAAPNTAPVQTPVGGAGAGGGCMISPNGGNDHVLALLLFIAALSLLKPSSSLLSPKSAHHYTVSH